MTKIPIFSIWHIFFFLFFLSTTTLSTPDLTSSKAALLTLRSSVGGRTLLWNTSETSPCKWVGIQCSNDVVVALRLPGFSLSGTLPEGVFTNLTSLKQLSLRFNHLSGQVPKDLSLLTELRGLNLQENNFSGEVPRQVGKMGKLVRLSLADNKFSGEVPLFLGELKRLKSLYLENNELSGGLPELKLELELFNVSNNRLNGSVPVSLSRMPVTAFGGTRLCGKPLSICPGLAAGTGVMTTKDKIKKKGLSGAAIAGIVIGSVVALAIILMIVVFFCCKRKSKQSNAVDVSSINKQLGVDVRGDKPIGEGENGGVGNGYSVSAAAVAAMTTNGNGKAEEVNGGGPNKKLVFFGDGVGGKVFDLEDLLRASAEVLGKGTFGTSYKAVLEIGTVVAVKRLKDVFISETEFKEKIEAVGAMEHGNLVPLRAYYYSRDEKLLVFDYMPMGSLSAFLHGNKGAGRTPLNWELRSSIALGVARGISYIHSQGPNTVHGSIKSSNVLLTKSYEPHVSDFGLSQVVGPSSAPPRSNGYRAPEVTDPRGVSQKADVYSFGVLLLELLTGKAPSLAVLNEEGVDLPRWVQSIVKDDWATECFDLELLRYQHAEEEMVQLLELALECASQHPDSRPSMSEVTRRIGELCSSSIKEDSDPQPEKFSDADDGSFR